MALLVGDLWPFIWYVHSNYYWYIALTITLTILRLILRERRSLFQTFKW
jgi:hypothetical protein